MHVFSYGIQWRYQQLFHSLLISSEYFIQQNIFPSVVVVHYNSHVLFISESECSFMYTDSHLLINKHLADGDFLQTVIRYGYFILRRRIFRNEIWITLLSHYEQLVQLIRYQLISLPAFVMTVWQVSSNYHENFFGFEFHFRDFDCGVLMNVINGNCAPPM